MLAWNRICRPGSVLGPQQHFLIENETALLAAPSKLTGAVAEIAKKIKKMDISGNGGTMSEKEREIAMNGDAGQAAGLMDRKKTYSGKK